MNLLLRRSGGEGYVLAVDGRSLAPDKVTIFISTHFMNEAERCDRSH